MTQQRHHLAALTWLQDRPQWVCWHFEERRGKRTKVPYDPRTGRRAESNNTRTWGSYQQAKTAWKQYPQRYDGVGYMFNGDITGVDLDHCVAADGSIEPWARAILDQLASYAEYSPSGTGIHVLVRGTVPKGIRRFVPKPFHPLHREAAIEMYCQGRYFTISGKHIEGTPPTIEARQDALDAFYAQIATPRSLDPYPYPESTPIAALNDEELIEKAMQAGNGHKFAALFKQGDHSGYGSASEADLALCLLLAFWTGRDTARMDHLFRNSALYREKWDSVRGKSTYGQETIQKAIAACGVVYDPKHSLHQLEREVERLLQQIAEHQGHLLGSERKRSLYQLTPRVLETSKVLLYLEENEYGDARFFAEAFAGQVCYDHTDKEWYLWHEHFWTQDTTGKIRQLVAGVLGTLYLKAAADLNTTQAEVELQIQSLLRTGASEASEEISRLKNNSKQLSGQMSELRARAKGLRSAKRMNNVLTFIQAEMGITADRWDTNPWLLAVPNGVLDLHTGDCRDGVPEDYIRTVAPTEWTGLSTPCPRFEQFLQEIFEDKPDRDTLIAFLQRLLGYGITGLTTHHIFPLFYGEEGRNGKDTLLDALKGVLGPLVGAASNDVFIAQEKLRSGGAATPHLCDLQGKRLVWGSETKEGDRLNIAQIKLLTGGGAISTRQLHGKQYTFTPTHKLLLITNYKPHADARDKAFWARACLIDFGMRFVDQPQADNERQVDTTLKETLKQERSGLLAWLIRGCLAWQERGLDIPSSVQVATDKYREEEDKLFLFIQECCIVAPHASVKAGALFSAYIKWMEASQFGKAMNARLFGEEMKKRFPCRESNGRRIYQGLGLLTPDDSPPNNPKNSRGSVEGQPFFAQIDESASEGILSDTGENGSRGSTESSSSISILDKAASEAVLSNASEKESRGCRGSRGVFPSNEKDPPTRGPKGGETLYTLYSPTAPIVPQPASGAVLQVQEQQSPPSTDPLLSSSDPLQQEYEHFEL